jgi:hypothetical protein
MYCRSVPLRGTHCGPDGHLLCRRSAASGAPPPPPLRVVRRLAPSFGPGSADERLALLALPTTADDAGAADEADYPLALIASIRAGNTLCTSPTMPRSATEKIGASRSLLMATMFFEPFMPTRCWVAPEIPQAT